MINYDNFSILTALAIGLIGNFHCIGMCSGIITVFSMSVSKDKHRQFKLFKINFRTYTINYRLLLIKYFKFNKTHRKTRF